MGQDIRTITKELMKQAIEDAKELSPVMTDPDLCLIVSMLYLSRWEACVLEAKLQHAIGGDLTDVLWRSQKPV